MATAVTPRRRAESPPSPTSSTEPVGKETSYEGVVAAATEIFSEELSLTQKLLNISSQVGNIPKSAFNKEQGYRYATEVDVLRALRPLLASSGVYIQFSVVDCQVVPREGRSLLTQVQLDYVVTDGTDTLGGSVFGYGMDTGDKGVYKAITGAKKYALMLLFLIDTGDDPEADGGHVLPNGPVGGSILDTIGADLWPDGADTKVPVVTPTTRTDLVRGGSTTTATETQLARLREACTTNGVDTEMLRHLLQELFEVEVSDIGTYLRETVSSRDIGKLIMAVEAYGDGAEAGSYA